MKEQLTEINITRENGELLANISFDEMNVINADGIVVGLNYGTAKRFQDFGGEIYVVEPDVYEATATLTVDTDDFVKKLEEVKSLLEGLTIDVEIKVD